jgi:WD40 repeat protein
MRKEKKRPERSRNPRSKGFYHSGAPSLRGVQSGRIGLLIRASAAGLLVLAPALTHVTDASAVAVPESPQVVAQLWKLDASKPSDLKMIESRYLVDLSAMTVILDKQPTSDYGLETGKKQRSNEEVYVRLLKRFRESGITSQDDVLGVAIREIEKGKGAGYQPSSQILVSPDGGHAVLSPQYGAYALVDLGTLSAESLTERRGLEPVPMAWSPDSQFLAFPSSDNKSVIVYDIKRREIQSTIHSGLKDPCALAWSPDMRKMVILDLVGRRLHVSPLGLLGAFSGHPDFRNDLVLRVTNLTDNENRSVVLTSNLTEQSSYEYGIQWK